MNIEIVKNCVALCVLSWLCGLVIILFTPLINGWGMVFYFCAVLVTVIFMPKLATWLDKTEMEEE